MTITDFLWAQIAEDEALAKRVAERMEHVPPGASGGVGNLGLVGYRFDRVFAECEAKRQIMAEHSEQAPYACSVCSRHDFPCPTLLALAAVYADHPDYRQEWVA